jgi:glycerol-3-phosphate acyltransferase PlsY
MTLILKALVSFLLGSIPFAMVAMIGTGIDITKVGSKNPGFNNVRRVGAEMGLKSVWWRAFLIALPGDIFKASLAVLLLSRGETTERACWILGIAAVMGHCWSPFLAFNGGKGVATMVGMLLVVDWRITTACLPLYPLLRFIGRKLGWKQEGAISSMTTMALIATLVFVFRGPESGLFAYIALAIIIIRHIPNIREIIG